MLKDQLVEETRDVKAISLKECLEAINSIKTDIAELNNKLTVVVRDIDNINNTLQLLTNAPEESDNSSDINNDFQANYYDAFSKYLFDIRTILDVIASHIIIDNKPPEYKYYQPKDNDGDDYELLPKMLKKKNIKIPDYMMDDLNPKRELFDKINKNKIEY